MEAKTTAGAASPDLPAGAPLTHLNLPFLFLTWLKGNGNSCDVIEIEGHLDHALLRAAIASVLAVHPLLSCRIRRRGLRYVWQPVPPSEPIDLRIRRLDEEPDDPYLCANVWNEPLPVERGRALRFHLTETPMRSYLQIITAQVSADARACFRLAHDLANHYTILASGGRPPQTPIAPTRPRPSLWEGVSRAARCGLAARALREIACDALTSGRALRLRRTTSGPTGIEVLDFGAEGLKQLRRRAVVRGVTMHSLFQVAAARTCGSHNRGDGPVRLIDLFSLRPHAREDVGDVFDCMVLPFTVTLDTRASDETLLRKSAEALERLKRGGILVELYRQHVYAATSLLLPKLPATRLVCTLVAKANVILSNPGRLPYEVSSFGPAPVREYLSFSQLFPPGKIMLLFSTYRDRLRFIAVYDKHAFPAGVRSTMLEPLAAYLRTI